VTTIVDLAVQALELRTQAAAILAEAFPHSNGWPTVAIALEEIDWVAKDGFVRAALEDHRLLGWVGGLPEYRGKVWELHPIVVDRDHRLNGIGRTLVHAFEEEARRRGGLTVTLGTDDEFDMTSVSGVDLYRDVPAHIAGLRDLGGRHPFLFYRKLGYVVTGLMPDANGRGRPDIYMSKAL